MKTTISNFIIGRNVPLKTEPIQMLPPNTTNQFTEIKLYLLSPKQKRF
jgi:hypothetical protein